MSKVYISLINNTAELKDIFIENFSSHEVLVNENNRTTTTDGSSSKMQEANNWGANLYIAVRHKSDTRLSVNPADAVSAALSDKVAAALRNVVGEYVPVNHADYLAEINNTNADAILYIMVNMESGEPEEIADAISAPCKEWLNSLQAQTEKPQIEQKPAEINPESPTDDEQGISDAAIGKALRTLIEAFKAI